jgi:hypothetical protein
MGYHRAGFDVVGVDIKPQPRYPFEFQQGDALATLGRALWYQREGRRAMGFDLGDFDAIHASPPCQHYANVTRWRGDHENHPDLVAETRGLLDATGLPWVMENVRESPVRGDILLCGTALGLAVRRHRHFETNWSGLMMTWPCQHRASDLAFEHKQERAYADAMGCEWMSNREARQAIPPAYTEWIGHQLLQHVLVNTRSGGGS